MSRRGQGLTTSASEGSRRLTDLRLIGAAAFFRSAGTGVLGVLLALYLAVQGFDAGRIGALIAVGLAGNAAGTFFVSLWADRFGRRNTLLGLAACMAAGGMGLAFFSGFPALAATCFLGMVNGMGRERGAVFTLEQTILSDVAGDRDRTQALAWYNLVVDAGQAVGSLLGGLPLFLRQAFGAPVAASYQWILALSALLGGLGFLLYLPLSRQVEVHGPTPWHRVTAASRRIIARLSLLFGFDSLAGGFLPASLLAYWFFRRFGVDEGLLGPLFFAAHLANALSYLGAAWLARRIGLLNTMVFTHLPASLCLLAIPFTPTLGPAVLLYLFRECMVEMDVPTRQSYLMAVVEPGERTLAAGMTNLARMAAWAIAPGLAGLSMKALSLSLPLFAGGGMKIAYDLALYREFRHVRPPGERRC